MPHQTTLLDISKVAGAATGAGAITIVSTNEILTTVSILLAIGYTVWKWIKDYKKG